jgi:hypothetical protein
MVTEPIDADGELEERETHDTSQVSGRRPDSNFVKSHYVTKL